MRTLVNAVQTYDQVVEVCCYCASVDSVLNNSLDPWTAAPLTDPSVHRWSPSPKLRAVSPAGSRARPNRRSFHTITHVSREFVDHTVRFFRRSFNLDECVYAGRCAVFTGAESFSTLRLRSTSSCARVARQQRGARPLWRQPACTDWLLEDTVAQERTQLECRVMKYSTQHVFIRVSICHFYPRLMGCCVISHHPVKSSHDHFLLFLTH
jgi:hypothetical protein